MSQSLNPKFAKVVALMRSTTHAGERASATERAREMAMADGKSLDRAIDELDHGRAAPGLDETAPVRTGGASTASHWDEHLFRSTTDDLFAQLGVLVGSSRIGLAAETALLRDLQAIVAADGPPREHRATGD